MAIVADPNNVAQLDNVALLATAIGRDAFLAARAAEELERRGPGEARQALTARWTVSPTKETTENFPRGAFRTFGNEFASHLIELLELGTQAAVNVAAFAFPADSSLSGGSYTLLGDWARGRRTNSSLHHSRAIVSPIIAIGSAGLSEYGSAIVKLADGELGDLCAETLIRMFVQANSEREAHTLLGDLRSLVAVAHDDQWRDRHLLLKNRFPAWPLTSAAIDVLIKHGLTADEPTQIRSFAADALMHAEDRSIAAELIRRTESGQILETDVLKILAFLGGSTAAAFVARRANDHDSLACVLPWVVESLDDSAIESLKRDPKVTWLVARGLGKSGRAADWIEDMLTSASFLDRGYAGLGLAYARGAEARPALEKALTRVVGEGTEALRERILLEAALLHAGAHEYADSLLTRLPLYSSLRDDLAKRDIVAALGVAKGADHAAVRAWQRVTCVRDFDESASAPSKRTAPTVALQVVEPVEIGILTIKPEELNAVLAAFPDGRDIYVSANHRHYNLRSAAAGGGRRYRVAIVRHLEQGTGEAHEVARDLIADLNPALLLLVGIAGAVPGADVTLGDVVISTRVNDYTVEARKEGGEIEYSISGGRLDREIEGAIANLEARKADLGDWTAALPLQPRVEVTDDRLYGSEAWKRKVRASLEPLVNGDGRRAPKFVLGVIGSSDRLIKDTAVLIDWLDTARHLVAVEMESAGVYRAARDRCPMLAIRGISDIVGFKRDDAWTQYACQSAAAFANAFLRTSPAPVARDR